MKSFKKKLRFYLGVMIGSVRYYLGVDDEDSWEGAFNRQTHRQRMFEEIFAEVGFSAAFETGTYHGATTEFIHRKTKVPVFTIENGTRLYGYARARLRRYSGIKVYYGDSRKFLEHAREIDEFKNQNVFFYLDAHWGVDIPLRREVEVVFKRAARSIVMIDDFKVPEDEGYSYDDYGAGRVLSLEYLFPLSRAGWGIFFPSLESKFETGARRGSVVLAREEAIIRKLDALKSLRRMSE